MGEYGHEQWRGTTGGTPWMQRALVSIFKIIPVEVFYGVMALVVPFYMLVNRSGYRSTYRFFRRRLGRGRLASFFSVYANHFVFGQVILDRFAMYAGRRFRLNINGQEWIDKYFNSDGGVVMASSHVGNYELVGYSLDSGAKTVNALVFGGETETVMSNRDRMFSRNSVRMIPVKDDMSHLFSINNALDGGEVVSMPCDRVFGSARTVKAAFFGEDAAFPAGPFMIAVKKAVPMIDVFVMKKSARAYDVYVLPLETALTGNTATQELVAAYARELEAMVRRYPYQWFNYFDFWRDGDK